MKKRQLNFLLSILSEYAKESGQSIRSKKDLSPLETWLIKKLYENCFYVSDNNFKTKLIKAINKIVKYVLLKLSRVFKKLKKYVKPKFYGYKSPDDVIERLIEK